MGRNTSPAFGGDVNTFATGTYKAPHGFFTFPIAIHIGRIDEIYAMVHGRIQDGIGIRVTKGTAPFTTYLPSSCADFGNLKSSFSEGAFFHFSTGLNS
jgi:hypothetical protein